MKTLIFLIKKGISKNRKFFKTELSFERFLKSKIKTIIKNHFPSQKEKALLIAGFRICFLVLLYSTLIFKYFSHFEFINTEGVFSVYSVLTLSFFIHGLYVFFIDQVNQIQIINELIFYYESLAITLFAYFLKFNPSIYILMYLMNIILAIFLGNKRSILCLSFLTSFLFHILIFFLPPISNTYFIFLLFINNFAFLTTGFLGAFYFSKIKI